MSTPVEQWRPGMDITGGRLQYMLERLNTSSTVNVETFGAVGDGVTDDTLAIQAALNLARDSGGGLVQFTPGKTYAVSTFLVAYDYTTIYAYGATIKAIGNTGLLRNFRSDELFSLYDGHSHIQILGGVWDGNAFNGTTGSVTAMTNVMGFVHCSDITVRDATVKNVSSSHGVEFNSTNGGRVINCNFFGYQDNSGDNSRQFSEAVQIDISKSGSSSIGAFDDTPSKNILVDGCTFSNSDRCGYFGRAVGSHTLVAGKAYYGIQVVNNRIDGTLQEGIRGYGWRRAVVANNVLNSTGMTGIWMGTSNPSTTAVDTYDLTISANTITNAQADSGIRVIGYSASKVQQVTVNGNSINGGGSGTANGIHTEYCDSPVVSGNTLAFIRDTGIYNNNSDSGTITSNTVRNCATNAINVTSSTGTIVSSNHVNGTSTNHGIFVTTSNDFLITGNRVTNAGGSTNSACIRLGAGASDGTVTNNRIVKGTSIKGISLAASLSGSTIANNDMTGNGWPNTAASGAASGFYFETGATASLNWAGSTTVPGDNLIS